MSTLKKCVVSLLLLFVISAAYGNPYYIRGYGNANHGYYGPWYHKDYYKYNYYYRPSPEADYQYHYCYYYPRDRYGRSNYYYYYNTRTNKYWGRCHAGSTNYESLAPEFQRPDLANIQDGSFLPQKRMTPIPGMVPATDLIGPPRPEPQQPEPPPPPKATN